MVEQDIEKMVMYHYTSPLGWKEISEGDSYSQCLDQNSQEWMECKEKTGLIPKRRFIREGNGSLFVPAEATKPAIFGLTHPNPESWVNYNDGQNPFDLLIGHCSSVSAVDEKLVVLLRVDLLPEDNAIIVDYIYRWVMENEINKVNNLRRRIEIEAVGSREYWKSRVPLAEYSGGYILPEVVVFNPIPLERVHFVLQRELHEFLDEVHAKEHYQRVHS